MIAVGETIILEDGGNGKHLWLVIAHARNCPNHGDQNIMIVNFTSHKSGCDESCVLHPGDHPYIKKATIINYLDMKLIKNSILQDDVDNHRIEQRQRVNPVIIRKIADGAMVSPHTTPRQRRLIREQFPEMIIQPTPPAAEN